MPTSNAPVGRGSGPLIAALTIALLAAMAFAIPESPIALPNATVPRGYVIGHRHFSSALAEVIARQGYNLLVLDLATARLGAGALWPDQLHRVASRRYPVWGWLDPAATATPAEQLLRSLNLAGVLVHGRNAVAQAQVLRQVRPGLRIVPVVKWGATPPTEGEYAVAMDAPTFALHASEHALPLLVADQLDHAAIDAALARVEGGCFVSRVALLDR